MNLGGNTPLLMFDGSTKLVSQLQIGDQIMSANSTPVTVTFVSERTGPMYKVISSDNSPGEIFECSLNHVVSLKLSARNTIRYNEKTQGKWARNAYYEVKYFEHICSSNIVTRKAKKFSCSKYATQEDAKNAAHDFLQQQRDLVKEDFIWQPTISTLINSKNIGHERVLFMPEVVRFKHKEGQFKQLLGNILGVEPSEEQIQMTAWLIGAWIGDGTTANISFTVGINEEHTMIERLKHVANIIGCDAHIRIPVDENVKYVSLVHRKGDKNAQSTFRRLLKGLGIFEHKAIPSMMMYDDVQQVRLPLLAGLMDTDGHFRGDLQQGYDFVQVREEVTRATATLARLCGFRVNKVKSCLKSHSPTAPKGTYWRIGINGPHLYQIPCVLTRKQAKRPEERATQANKRHTIWGFDVEKIENGTYYTIQTDKNELVLSADLTCM